MKVFYVKRDLNPLYIQMRKVKHEYQNVRYIHADKTSLTIYAGEWSRNDEEVSDEMEEQ